MLLANSMDDDLCALSSICYYYLKLTTLMLVNAPILIMHHSATFYKTNLAE
jgi:hypothetical protein